MKRTHKIWTRLVAMLALALALHVPASALSSSSSCQVPSIPAEAPLPDDSCCCSGGGGECGAMPATDTPPPSSGCGCEIQVPSAPASGVIPVAAASPAPRVERLAPQHVSSDICAVPVATRDVHLDIGAAPPGSARPLYAFLSLLLI
ncbi:MAG: hypothetical protein ACKVU1_00420 [bacterium]